MSEEIYQTFAIFDRTPSGVLRHIRRYLNAATSDLGRFQFADAQRDLERARRLADALQLELETPPPETPR